MKQEKTGGDLDAFLNSVERELGAGSVDRTGEKLDRYGENTLPTGDRHPAAIVYPDSTEGVQALIRLANEARVPLWPVSTGNNQGLGTRSPVHHGQVIVDLGRRMNRI